MTFEEQYPIEGNLVLTTIAHEKIFQVKPLVNIIEMEPSQVVAELKVARIKLNERIKSYKPEKIDIQRVKDKILEVIEPNTAEVLLQELGI